MERTKYFNYTKPGQTQLNYTESSKADAIIKRQRSTAQMGIRTGFQVSINVLDATKIDIGPGEGYTGGYFEQKNLRNTNAGEKISTLTDSSSGSPGYIPTKVGQALANYSIGIQNYVSLVYSETESIKLAENRIPYTEHDTIVTETYSVEVLTSTDWALLSNDDLENRILVAIVTAQGLGQPLTLSNVVQVTQPSNHPVASSPVLVTGVIIDQVSEDTIIGTGTLRWDTAVDTLYWTAPGDYEGSGTAISSNGIYYLYSSNTDYYLKVSVVSAALPTAATSESITIKSLYGRVIPLYSAVDQAHRDMIGTGQRSTSNPHALHIDDISGGTFPHADLFHVNGISSHARAGQLACSIDNNTIKISNLGAQDDSFLIDGITYQSINGIAAGADALIDFSPGTPFDSGEYIIFLDNDSNPQYVRLSDLQITADANFGGRVRIVDMKSSSNGACKLRWTDANKTLEFQGVDATYGTAVYWEQSTTGTYYKLYSNNTANWIIVYVYGNLNAIGGNATFSFDTEFNETEYPIQSILKLCETSWDGVGEVHYVPLMDLRRFNTADNRDTFEAEHDSSGSHTKVLQNTLRVVNITNALYGSADSYAIYGLGGNATKITAGTGVYGVGLGSIDTPTFGIYGFAYNWSNGASCVGVAGIVNGIGATAVYGQATGVNATGLYGYAPGVGGTAVYGKGTSIGIIGSGDTGVYCDGSLFINQAQINGVVATNSHILIKLAGGAVASINVKV